jgi:hypothetical protein
MKKTSAIFTLLLLSVSAINAQTTMANSVKVIEMTNHATNMYNSYTANLKKAGDGLKRAHENMTILSESKSKTIYSWDCSNIAVESGYKEDLEKSIKATPAFSEKTEILSGINYIAENNERLANSCKALNDYFVKKEYSNDTRKAKYAELYNNLASAYTDLSGMWRKVMNLVSDAGDRAEIETLKRNPIADFIIPMKTDLSSVKKILNLFMEDQPDYSIAKKPITTLQTTIVKSRSLKGKKVAFLNQYKKKGVFEGFYLSMDKFIKVATDLEKVANPANNIDENQQKQDFNNNLSILANEYNSLIESYNMM